MSMNRMDILQVSVGDPSKETKEDLTAKGTSCLMDTGAAVKFVVRNSKFHENMDRTIRDFVHQEQVMDSTMKILESMNIVLGDMHRQAERIHRCFEELPNVQSAVDSCRVLMKPAPPPEPQQQPHHHHGHQRQSSAGSRLSQLYGNNNTPTKSASSGGGNS